MRWTKMRARGNCDPEMQFSKIFTPKGAVVSLVECRTTDLKLKRFTPIFVYTIAIVRSLIPSNSVHGQILS